MVLKPVRTVKNEILVKEGELIEETVFVKNGLLSLEVTVNLNKAYESTADVIPSRLRRKSIFERVIDNKKRKPERLKDINQEHKPTEITTL